MGQKGLILGQGSGIKFYVQDLSDPITSSPIEIRPLYSEIVIISRVYSLGNNRSVIFA